MRTKCRSKRGYYLPCIAASDYNYRLKLNLNVGDSMWLALKDRKIKYCPYCGKRLSKLKIL